MALPLAPDSREGQAFFEQLDAELHALEFLSTPCWLFDVRRCQWLWGNKAALRIWHAGSRDEMRRRDVRTSQSDAMYEHLNSLLESLLEDGGPRFEWLTLEPLGVPHRYYLSHRPMLLPDSTHAVLSEAAMEPPAEEIVALAANASLTVVLFDTTGRQISRNPAFRKLLGDRMESLHLSDLLPERGSVHTFVDHLDPSTPIETEVELNTTRGRRWYRVEHRSVQSSSHERRVLATLFDITESRLEREELRRLATTDRLSGSLNRAGLMEEMKAWIARGDPFQLLYVDLDGLKRLNDVFGHSSGDKLLKATAKRIRALGGGSVSGRVGGDEFVILAPPNPGFPEEVHDLLSRDFQFNETYFRPSASIGVAQFPEDAADARALIRCGDRAMYRSKRQGRDRVTHFHRDIELSFERAEAIASALPTAVLDGQMRAVVQPVFDLNAGKVVGGECLVRWKSPSLGTVRPDEFIPIAEQSGAIHAIGRLMMRRAAELLQEMRSLPRPIYLAVNLSASDLMQESLSKSVENLTNEFGLAPQNLHIELTERMDIGSWASVQQTMEELTNLGCSLSLDDFGAGYASLQWLEALPFDTVKIDKSLVQRLPARRAREMVKAIATMADSLDLTCLGEGIETAEQLGLLHTLGVNLGQGFLLARPLEADDWITGLMSGALSFPGHA